MFVSFGNYPDVKSIIKSKMFYPVFITGLSGNGKTMGVTQACVKTKENLSESILQLKLMKTIW